MLVATPWTLQKTLLPRSVSCVMGREELANPNGDGVR